MLGKKHSEETKKKMTLNHVGFRGKHFSEKSKIKISLAGKGRIHSEETKRKISKAHIGKKLGIKLSIEHKRKLSEYTGNKSGNWKGGITDTRHKIRMGNKYKAWRTSCFIRDNFTCQYCGQNGGKLEAHHIKRFNTLLEEARYYMPLLDLFSAAMLYTPLWDLNNGITLCKECHFREHKK
jgi:hypothetical protein